MEKPEIVYKKTGNANGKLTSEYIYPREHSYKIMLENDFQSGFGQLIKFMLHIAEVKGPLMAILFKNGPSSIKISEEDFKRQQEKKLQGMEVLETFFKKGVDEGILTPDISVKRMAIVFQSIFPINVEMMLYGEKPLTCEQMYDMFMSVFKK